MTPYEHSCLSVRDFKGSPEDYIEIHKFLDQTKSHVPHWAHRLVLHNSWGIDLCEQIFGDAIINSDEIPISVREIARMHIIQDLGKVPTLSDWFRKISIDKQSWMVNPRKKDLDWLKENIYKKEANEL